MSKKYLTIKLELMKKYTLHFFIMAFHLSSLSLYAEYYENLIVNIIKIHIYYNIIYTINFILTK